MKRVVIVGGGITGLAVAHALERAEERCEVRLVEAGPHLGGNVQTLRHNGFIIDAGPDSWLASRPQATRLVRDIGLADELIGERPDVQRVYVLWQRRLYAIPDQLILRLPSSLRPFIDSELLGWDAKLRAALDFVIPRRESREEEDESIASLVGRRLGSDVVERLAAPLFGATLGGDPASLSVQMCAPHLAAAEREHGSLLGAVRAERSNPRVGSGELETAPRLSLKRGIGDLVVNVAHKLRDADVLTSTSARRVSRLPEGDARGRWTVETTAGSLDADEVVLAVPGHVAAGLLDELDPALSAMCREMVYTSVASIFLAYRKFDVRHPLDAAGIFIPATENRSILACNFVSSQWDHRAPAGQILLRIVVGGVANEEIVDRPDPDLVAVARSEVKDLLSIERPPMFAKVFRSPRAVPQPRVGHASRMNQLLVRASTHEGLHIGGNGYSTTGISDDVRQGETIAEQITPLKPST